MRLAAECKFASYAYQLSPDPPMPVCSGGASFSLQRRLQPPSDRCFRACRLPTATVRERTDAQSCPKRKNRLPIPRRRLRDIGKRNRPRLPFALRPKQSRHLIQRKQNVLSPSTAALAAYWNAGGCSSASPCNGRIDAPPSTPAARFLVIQQRRALCPLPRSSYRSRKKPAAPPVS